MKLLRYPVFIPSKGRPNDCKTAKLLACHGVPFEVVVEPQETDAYAAQFPHRVLTLPFANLGSVHHAQGWIHERAKRDGVCRHWQLDDDISAFLQVHPGNGRSTIMHPADALAAMESFVDRYANVHVAAPMYAAFARLKRTPFTVNGLCSSCLLLLTDVPHRFRTRYDDSDYCIQVLASGNCTLLFHAFAIDIESPDPDHAHADRSEARAKDADRRKAAEAVRALWPMLPIKVKPTGTRLDVSQVWRRFTQPLQPL